MSWSYIGMLCAHSKCASQLLLLLLAASSLMMLCWLRYVDPALLDRATAADVVCCAMLCCVELRCVMMLWYAGVTPFLYTYGHKRSLTLGATYNQIDNRARRANNTTYTKQATQLVTNQHSADVSIHIHTSLILPRLHKARADQLKLLFQLYLALSDCTAPGSLLPILLSLFGLVR